jgi:hypothetical protein
VVELVDQALVVRREALRRLSSEMLAVQLRLLLGRRELWRHGRDGGSRDIGNSGSGDNVEHTLSDFRRRLVIGLGL